MICQVSKCVLYLLANFRVPSVANEKVFKLPEPSIEDVPQQSSFYCMNSCVCSSPHICHCGNNSRWRSISPGYGAYSQWDSNKENTPLNPQYPHAQTHPIPYSSLANSYAYAYPQPIYQSHPQAFNYLEPHPYAGNTAQSPSLPNSLLFPPAPLQVESNGTAPALAPAPTSNAKRKHTNALSGNGPAKKKGRPSVMGTSALAPRPEIITA
jgi:hypothetical protein